MIAEGLKERKLLRKYICLILGDRKRLPNAKAA